MRTRLVSRASAATVVQHSKRFWEGSLVQTEAEPVLLSNRWTLHALPDLLVSGLGTDHTVSLQHLSVLRIGREARKAPDQRDSVHQDTSLRAEDSRASEMLAFRLLTGFR